MNCDTCKKKIEKHDLMCGLCVENKQGGFDQRYECGKCHEHKWNMRYIDDLKAIANECKTPAQLQAAFKASHFVQRWKKTNNTEMLTKALEVYDKRKASYGR